MSTNLPEGNAIIYCEGAFNTTNGKTAHGLVRRGRRYIATAVVDSTYAGSDAGEVLDGRSLGIPIEADIETAMQSARERGIEPSHLVVGLAPDGGRLDAAARNDLKTALSRGLHVVCGLHDWLVDDAEMVALAEHHGVTLTDVRKPPALAELHFFSGKIEEVDSLKIAVLGTDSAVGKRTTAWRIVEAYEAEGRTAELIGTGQTAWLQGARYSLVMDALVNDFVAGEIEHAVHTAWLERRPDAIVIEGQGSLMNPAYPGGFEILAAGRPDVVVLQHAPARKEYDGFPGHPLHPLTKQIQAIELISARPVVAVTLNHENLGPDGIDPACRALAHETGLPVFDVLRDGADELVRVLNTHRTQGSQALA